MSAFADDFSEARLSEITVEDLKDWMADGEDWSARTRINYLTKISQLYNYALKHGWVDANLAERIDRPSAEDKTPEIFTVEQAQQLLSHANDHDLLPYIAIGLFAGLRSAELMRLDFKAVNMDEKVIVVDKEVAKRRSRRVVDMCDALHEWLKTSKRHKGPVVDDKKFRDHLTELKAAAGIEHWPHNGLRHSFGSYHLALHGDSIRTAQQMGHRSADVIHNHYKALVLKSEAEKFWNLKPAQQKRGKTPTTATPGPKGKSDPLLGRPQRVQAPPSPLLAKKPPR